MKKIIISAAVGLSVFGGAAAFAAGFGPSGLSSQKVAGGDVTVSGCDGATVSYTVDSATGKLDTATVTAQHADCVGGHWYLTLKDGAATILGTANGNEGSAGLLSTEVSPAAVVTASVVMIK